MNNNSFIVMKFGGTSVATKDSWQTIIEQCIKHLEEGVRPFLVCSALAQISDQLEQLIVAESEEQRGEILSSVREKHFRLLAEFSLSEQLISSELDDLEKIITGLPLQTKIDPAVKARLLSAGELLSTKIGAVILTRAGLGCKWLDARQHLTSESAEVYRADRHYLAATVPAAQNLDLQQQLLADDSTDVWISQGFIAADAVGDTVLLGRGGSDTSAALFAVALAARQLEIWTDVPGLFSADPQQIDSARIILQLDYAESQELATTGAKVLHPACLGPVEVAEIPLHIRWTSRPEVPGTVISQQARSRACVKGVSSKNGIWLISMETLSMWQHAGFLADIFSCFKRAAISIDLVSTSESNVTVSLDSSNNVLADDTLASLLTDLQAYCEPELIGPVATVTLVGSKIRSILHRLGPAFSLFEDKKIYLLSQSASDLNLSIAVDQAEAKALVDLLHSSFFTSASRDDIFGPTWLELQAMGVEVTKNQPQQRSWWQDNAKDLIEILAQDDACYVYSLPEISKSVEQILQVTAFSRVHYAMKANNNTAVLALLADKGIDFDCVSIGEIQYLLKALPGLNPERILFTPNFAAINEYQQAYAIGCRVTLDNLYCLQAHPQVFRGRQLVVRLDPGVLSAGHHKHVQTTGRQSKFGIAVSEVEELQELCQQHEVDVYALHVHAGSGIHDPQTWLRTARFLAEIAKTFPAVRVLDLGGGFGVAEQTGQAVLDVGQLQSLLADFQNDYPEFELWAEPGRYLVSAAGVLLARVTQTKEKGGKAFVGLAAGMNALIRPSLYGAFHQIVNLSRLDTPASIHVDVVGPICETGDVLGHDRWLAASEEGDIMLIANAGAYSQVMASTYNLRKIPPEKIHPA